MTTMTMTTKPQVNFDVPLSKQAVLIEFHVSNPVKMRQKDVAASVELCHDKRVAAGNAAVYKDLLRPKCTHQYSSVVSDIRDNVIKYYCQPWFGGCYLLLMTTHGDFMDDYNQKEALAKREFLKWCVTIYPREIEAARIRLGDLFDEKAFASPEELQRIGLKLTLDLHKVPDTNFAMQLGEGMAERARENERERMSSLIARPYEQLQETCRQFIERWSLKQSKKWDPAVIEKLKRLASVAPKMDLTGKLGDVCELLSAYLPDPSQWEEMRKDADLCSMVCDGVRDAADQVDLLSSELDKI